MPTMTTERVLWPIIGPPPDCLNNGDRLTRAEFHELYEKSPPGTRAELIGGIVHMASPVKLLHSDYHAPMTGLLSYYQSRTKGVKTSDNVTVVLSDDSEVQPDVCLRILADGSPLPSRSRSTNYLHEPPELVIEVSDSSRNVDLNAKRVTYENHGVQEYLVLNLRDARLHAFDFANASSLELTEGVYHSKCFPGLWIDVGALFEEELEHLYATLQLGLASPEHAEFVLHLEARRAAHAKA